MNYKVHHSNIKMNCLLSMKVIIITDQVIHTASINKSVSDLAASELERKSKVIQSGA